MENGLLTDDALLAKSATAQVVRDQLDTEIAGLQRLIDDCELGLAGNEKAYTKLEAAERRAFTKWEKASENKEPEAKLQLREYGAWQKASKEFSAISELKLRSWDRLRDARAKVAVLQTDVEFSRRVDKALRHEARTAGLRKGRNKRMATATASSIPVPMGNKARARYLEIAEGDPDGAQAIAEKALTFAKKAKLAKGGFDTKVRLEDLQKAMGEAVTSASPLRVGKAKPAAKPAPKKPAEKPAAKKPARKAPAKKNGNGNGAAAPVVLDEAALRAEAEAADAPVAA